MSWVIKLNLQMLIWYICIYLCPYEILWENVDNRESYQENTKDEVFSTHPLVKVTIKNGSLPRQNDIPHIYCRGHYFFYYWSIFRIIFSNYTYFKQILLIFPYYLLVSFLILCLRFRSRINFFILMWKTTHSCISIIKLSPLYERHLM